MDRLETMLGAIKLRNPILCASGCFGYAYEMKAYTELSKIGAVSLKTVTREPRKGNPPPRIHEIRGGILSSIGLQNCGLENYIKEKVPRAQQVLRPDQIFLSIAGGCEADYLYLAEEIEKNYNSSQVAALEVNTACPNVQKGAGVIAKDTKLLYRILSQIVRITSLPVIVKISTDFDEFCEAAKTAEAAGVQAVYTANTPVGMAINIRTGKPAIGNKKAPLNGPVVKPIGIGKTWDLYHAVNIPIIASGGICCVEDVIEYMMAGAAAVGVGTYNFVDPNIGAKLVDDLEEYAEKNQIHSIGELTGIAAK